jgi:hypothetical protein
LRYSAGYYALHANDYERISAINHHDARKIAINLFLFLPDIAKKNKAGHSQA